MKRKTSLLLFTAVIALSILACSALTGNNTNGSDTSGDTANILFEDDFSANTSGWDRYSDNEGYTDYEDGAYKIGVYADSYYYWASPYQNFGDVVIEVQSQKISGGDDMQYGIVCHHEDIDNWYALVISGDGFAAIRKRYQGSDLEFIADWVEVDAINTGNSTNDLRAECANGRLALYVNGTLAIETTDSDLTSGDAGLMAGTFEQFSTEVLFDNFVVRQP